MDLTSLSHECLSALMGELFGSLEGLNSVEDACVRLARGMYEKCVHQGSRSLVLSRVFQSFPYSRLPEDIARAADQAIGRTAGPQEQFLVLMATWGDEEAWRDRRVSQRHKALSLEPDVVQTVPMLSRAIQQIGFDLGLDAGPNGQGAVRVTGVSGAFGVFHVEDAVGSCFVPAQAEFVAPHAVQSVVGAGAKLPHGGIAFYIGFSRHTIAEFSAVHFSAMMVEFWKRIHTLTKKPFSQGTVSNAG